jgi:hypothetical protein
MMQLLAIPHSVEFKKKFHRRLRALQFSVKFKSNFLVDSELCIAQIRHIFLGQKTEGRKSRETVPLIRDQGEKFDEKTGGESFLKVKLFDGFQTNKKKKKMVQTKT